MDVVDAVRHFFAGTDINTFVMAWGVFELRRATPYFRALVRHFKLAVETK